MYIYICICVCIAIDNLPSVNISITYDNSREKLLHKGLYASLIISVLPSTYLYLNKSVLEVHLSCQVSRQLHREACVGGTPTPCRSNLHFTPSHGGALGLHQVLCCRGRGRKFRLAIEHAGRCRNEVEHDEVVVDFLRCRPCLQLQCSLPLRVSQTKILRFRSPMIYLSPHDWSIPNDLSFPK